MIEEAKSMILVANHDHIVNFHGISMNGENVYILLEFCSFGSVDKFLRRHSENFRMKMDHGNYKDVVSWCLQVADAMEFLAKPESYIIHVSHLNIHTPIFFINHTKSLKMKVTNRKAPFKPHKFYSSNS